MSNAFMLVLFVHDSFPTTFLAMSDNTCVIFGMERIAL